MIILLLTLSIVKVDDHIIPIYSIKYNKYFPAILAAKRQPIVDPYL